MIWATRRILIVLALLSLGCVRGDWINETLTLVDVTGTWEGVFRTPGYERTIRWVLQQKGGKVRGEAQTLDGVSVGSIEGLVKGDVFSWQLTGPFVPIYNYTASRSYRGDAAITLDEMRGQADGPGCRCSYVLRRAAPDARQ